MSTALNRSDRRTLLMVGLVFLALVMGAIFLTPGQGVKSEVPTTYSTASAGARAAYLLLQDMGYRVTRWERELRQLPDPSRTTLVLAEPTGAPTERDTARLRLFVESGGRVVATGPMAGAFLPEASIVPRPWVLTWEKATAVSPAGPTRAAREITLVARAYWAEQTSATPLYTAERRIVAVRYGMGKGEIIWWASATPLTNAGLRETANLEFFLACLGEREGRQILWDEYFHGYQESTGRSAVRTPLVWLGAQGAILALAVLVTFARRSGPVLAPLADVRLSPLEFVQTLGGLYQHANAASVAVDICHQRFRYQLCRRLGMAINTPVEDLERALRERWHVEDDSFAPTLRRCQAARDNPNLGAKEALRMVQALYRLAGGTQAARRAGGGDRC
ncbi:MAG TPA: DUF4350 domain-containing protein [Vicinamibacterales bacterium]|jgi:hypothetical protein